MICRNCKKKTNNSFLDLGKTPAANSLLKRKNQFIKYYDLRVFVCTRCWLVQTTDLINYKSLFNQDYPYFSGYSDTWLYHLSKFVKKIRRKYSKNLNENVFEIASNDGTLLEILRNNQINAIGIEPTKSTANFALKKKFKVIKNFFGRNLARKLKVKSNFVIANNVIAHVPDLNDFIGGLKIFLSTEGIATFEFQYLPSLIKKNQFDTIYHEHFSYISLISAKNIFKRHNLEIFDCDKIKTHGGSLRIYVKHKNNKNLKISLKLKKLYLQEKNIGVDKKKYYSDFQSKVEVSKKQSLRLIQNLILKKKKIISYGAAAKANTFFNFLKINSNQVRYIVDKNPYKVGKFLPGSKIPIKNISFIKSLKPDYILIMVWNIKKEIIKDLKFAKKWKCKFITFIPKIKIN